MRWPHLAQLPPRYHCTSPNIHANTKPGVHPQELPPLRDPSLQYTSCIQYQQQYYAPQRFRVRDTVQLLSPLLGRPTRITVGAEGVITKIDTQGTPTIQFKEHLLNCLPVDIPCLRKLPMTSTWIITSLGPSSKPPYNIVAFASPKYGDTTAHNTPTIPQEFDTHHLKSIIQKSTHPTGTPGHMPDTDDFAPEIT